MKFDFLRRPLHNSDVELRLHSDSGFDGLIDDTLPLV